MTTSPQVAIDVVSRGSGGTAKTPPSWIDSGGQQDTKRARVSPRCGTFLDASILTPEVWAEFDQRGVVKLPGALAPAELQRLRERIDALMLGEAEGVDYDQLMMQLDSSTGRYEDLGEQTLGWKGRTLGYRKIQNLEHCPVYMEYCQEEFFKQACRHVYGEGKAINSFRTMFFNKPAKGGTDLPWHQDRWRCLDTDPQLTVYTALDDATAEKGGVKVIPGSHKLGVLNKAHHSGYLADGQVEEVLRTHAAENLDLKAGDLALLHNWTIHNSGINPTEEPRRALSVNYMLASTKVVDDVGEGNDKAFSAALVAGTGHSIAELQRDGFPTIFEAC